MSLRRMKQSHDFLIFLDFENVYFQIGNVQKHLSHFREYLYNLNISLASLRSALTRVNLCHFSKHLIT